MALSLPWRAEHPTLPPSKSRSTNGEGGDTASPSPGRSPKQPLPGIGLHDPLHGRQACPESNSFHQRVRQICPRSVSTIEGGGDTTISSPGMAPKQPLPEIGLHDPLHGRLACPEFNSFHQGVYQISPREGLFKCRPLPKRGQMCDITIPPQSLNDSPVGTIFVPSRLKTGTNLLHPRPTPIVERLVITPLLLHHSFFSSTPSNSNLANR